MDWFGLGLGSACHPTCSSQGRSISNLLSTVWLVETKFVGSSVGWFGFLCVIRFEGKTREMKQREIELEKEIDSNGPQTQRLQQERDESTNREREKSNLTTRFKTTRPVDYKSKDTKREKGGEIRLKIILERERERERYETPLMMES